MSDEKMIEVQNISDLTPFTEHEDLDFPKTPVAGDIWVDKSTADMYVYYENGGESDWIQVGGSAAEL